MTEREWALFKELAALWPKCADKSTWLTETFEGGLSRSFAAPSTRLQDYLAAAEKRWPGGKLTLDGSYRAYLTPSLGRTYEGKGATPCERALAALLQAAKEVPELGGISGAERG